MNKRIEALTRRLSSAVNKKIFCTVNDVPELALIYGVSVEKAMAVWRKSAEHKVKSGETVKQGRYR